MVRRSALRASDADREHVAERLRNAAGEGRLLAEELEDRLEAAFSARTYGELGAVVSDLPREAPRSGRPSRIPVRLRPATIVALVILFPMALAIAAAAIVAVVALLAAWAVAVSLAALFLGPRARALRGPWAVGCRAWQHRRIDHRDRRDRGVAGSSTPWL
jgi:uncharacterized protein DUF1707